MKYPLSDESHHIQILISGHVVSDPERCIQCGICSFNCPIGIDVRLHAWLGEDIEDPACLTCGECIEHCPRGVLHFEKAELFMEQKK
jgi:NAD-dependent dihydropyrimidine dehydrogenase PreA subunit